MNRLTLSSTLLGALIWVSAASAQTANSSPTAPAPGGLAGSPPSSSTSGPSGGMPGTGAAPLRNGAVAAGETDTERHEQAHDDKVMNICKGC